MYFECLTNMSGSCAILGAMLLFLFGYLFSALLIAFASSFWLLLHFESRFIAIPSFLIVIY